jgi:hypothetical protein
VRWFVAGTLLVSATVGFAAFGSSPASAAIAVTINGSTALFPNARAGQTLMVGALAGSFPVGAAVHVIECNAGNPTSGGCDTDGVVDGTANGDGSVTPIAYTLEGGTIGTDSTHQCAPATPGTVCYMDIYTGTLAGADTFFDKPVIKASPISAGQVTVTCSRFYTAEAKVAFKRNGTVVATVPSNASGVAKATFAAAAGDAVQCYGKQYKQKSKTLTL